MPQDRVCEPVCRHWADFLRPIFAGDRIFVLSGTALIEGRVANGRVVELRRIELAPARPTEAR